MHSLAYLARQPILDRDGRIFAYELLFRDSPTSDTAIIASVRFNDCIVMACGGCGNLTPKMCEPLRGRDVVLLPDNGKFDEWRDKGKEMRHLFRKLYISDIMEREAKNDGDDIGDLFLSGDPNLPTIDFNLTEL